MIPSPSELQYFLETGASLNISRAWFQRESGSVYFPA